MLALPNRAPPIRIGRIGDHRLSVADCTTQSKDTRKSLFSEEERATLCEAFANPSTREFIQLNVTVQRSFLGIIAGGLLLVALRVFMALRQAAATRQMNERLSKPKPKASRRKTTRKSQGVAALP